MGLFIGVLPVAAMWGLMELALALGGRDWPDLLAFPIFVGAYLALLYVGARICGRIFGS